MTWRAITVFATVFSVSYGILNEGRRDRSSNRESGAKALPVITTERLGGVYLVAGRDDNGQRFRLDSCDNFPLALNDQPWGAAGTLTLIAFPEESRVHFQNQAIALRLVNRTKTTATLFACDSQLYLVQEARDEVGDWREIERMPFAICGNSQHAIVLRPNEYWELKARRYAGPFKTKLRFRLDPHGEGAKRHSIYSNEFDGEIAKSQLRPPGELNEFR